MKDKETGVSFSSLLLQTATNPERQIYSSTTVSHPWHGVKSPLSQKWAEVTILSKLGSLRQKLQVRNAIPFCVSSISGGPMRKQALSCRHVCVCPRQSSQHPWCFQMLWPHTGSVLNLQECMSEFCLLWVQHSLCWGWNSPQQIVSGFSLESGWGN